jgi:ketosteroid isomerase-like protein
VTPAEREALLERSYAAFNSGDEAALRDVWAEDLVWSLSDEGAWPGPLEYHGHDGLHRFRVDWFGTWDEPWVARANTEHLPGDRSLIEARAGGKLQGLAFELTIWQVITFRDGRIATVMHHFEEDTARRAVA